MALRRHGPLSRREMPRSATPLKRSSKLAARSRKQASVDYVIDAAIRAAKDRDGWACQATALVADVACLGGMDGQHIIPRSVRKDLAADVGNIITVCRGHHEWINRHPKLARKLGLHGYSWDAP